MLGNKKGMILIAVYLIIAVLLILGTAFMSRSVSENRFAQREKNAIKAFYVSEAGIDRVTRDLFSLFETNFSAGGSITPGDFQWFNGLVTSPRSENPPYAGPPANASLGEGTYTVTINKVTVDTSAGQADVTLRSTGQVNNIPRVIKSVIRYKLARSGVFDYSYFVNNFGWFWGGGISANGDIRSNGNFNFGGNPTVNGDIYASQNPDLGANGDITGNSRNDSISFYRNQADAEARPTNPTADPNPPNDYSYPNGYDGNSDRFPNQAVLQMPYLGDLQAYRNLAVSQGGSISQGGVVLVNAVYGDDPTEVGPDGISGTPDDGTIVLIGTAANPIQLNGPVVVEGDVVIKGVVRGQGIIYSGRNTHIIGNITYDTPPAWPKPDTNPAATDAVNDTRDFLGLATKGNVIIGDYTRNSWRRTVTPYLQPPFTQAYDTNATDAVNGYDSDGNPLNGFRFDGDYTAFDGGTKDDGAGGAVNRKYYESSLSDNFIRNNTTSSRQIRRIDAVIYTNHAISGKVGNFTINGIIVSRDEAIVYNGNITMNYDIRIRNKGNDFNLPRALVPPQTVSWEEE